VSDLVIHLDDRIGREEHFGFQLDDAVVIAINA